MKAIVKFLSLIVVVCFHSAVWSQSKPLQWNIKEDGSSYVRFTALTQVWSRYTQTNAGTVWNGHDTPEVFDLGIRRLRFQVYGQIAPKVFFYVQFGQNNLNYQSKQNTGAFFHDAVTEFEAIKGKLSIGTGLTGWSGMSRYASPSVATILGVDAPLYQQATNGVNDQFLRKLSWYAKGQVGIFDYRVALSKPFLASNSVSPVGALHDNAEFATDMAPMQQQLYIQAQLLDKESDVTPYTTGTYLGSKQVCSLGFGLIREHNAMWYLDGADTLRHDMLLIGGDVFFEKPLQALGGNVLTVYGAYHQFDFGKKYLREIGAMNPITSGSADSFNGTGNNAPLVGSGSVAHIELAFLPVNWKIGEDGKMQFYAEETWANYTALADPMMMHEAGINYFIHGTHNAKMTLGGQWRPDFKKEITTGEIKYNGAKPMIVFQYQITI